MRIVLICLALVAGALPAMAATLDRMEFTDEQVRIRLKDSCIYERAKTVADDVPTAPGCACYSRELVKAMDEAEKTAWKRDGGLNASAMAKASAAWDKCIK